MHRPLGGKTHAAQAPDVCGSIIVNSPSRVHVRICQAVASTVRARAYATRSLDVCVIAASGTPAHVTSPGRLPHAGDLIGTDTGVPVETRGGRGWCTAQQTSGMRQVRPDDSSDLV